MKSRILWRCVSKTIGFCCTIVLACAAHANPLSDSRVFAQFTDVAESPVIQLVLDKYEASILWRARSIKGLVEIDCPKLNAAALALALSNLADVEYAEQSPHAIHELATTPCLRSAGSANGLPPLPTGFADVSSLQWSISNTGQTVAGVAGTSGADLNITTAWQVTKGSSQIVVAMVDIAIDIDHPSLSSALWTNPGEIPNDGIDNDGNGVVDDIHGVCVTDIPKPDPRPDYDSTDWIWSHGTAASGLIFGNESHGLLGVAPQCRLMAVSLIQPQEDFPELTERAIRALDYVLANGARVSSWSIVFHGLPETFKRLLKRATELNHILVCAAGNHNCSIDADTSAIPSEPATWSRDYQTIIGVAATDNRDCRALYNPADTPCGFDHGSNYGSLTVLCAAPGWWNLSLRAIHPGANPPIPYTWFEGTSAATPHVAGAVALLLSIHPEYTCADVRAALAASGRPTSGLTAQTITGTTLDIGQLINP